MRSLEGYHSKTNAGTKYAGRGCQCHYAVRTYSSRAHFGTILNDAEKTTMTANNSSHSYVTGSAPNDYEKPELYNVRWKPDLGGPASKCEADAAHRIFFRCEASKTSAKRRLDGSLVRCSLASPSGGLSGHFSRHRALFKS